MLQVVPNGDYGIVVVNTAQVDKLIWELDACNALWVLQICSKEGSSYLCRLDSPFLRVGPPLHFNGIIDSVPYYKSAQKRLQAVFV